MKKKFFLFINHVDTLSPLFIAKSVFMVDDDRVQTSVAILVSEILDLVSPKYFGMT